MLKSLNCEHVGGYVTGSELAVIKASAGAVTSTVMQIITAYRENTRVDRYKLRQLEQQTEAALIATRGHYLGDLYRINIEEIAKTQKQVESLSLSGRALDHAMNHLDHLSSDLTANLAHFRDMYFR